MATVTDPVEQVKARLRGVADQIKTMSAAGGPPDQFFRPFLQLLVNALHAHGGVVWSVEGDRIKPAHVVGGEELAPLDEPEASRLNQKLVIDSLVAEQSAAYHSSTEVGLPPQFTLLVIPVKANGNTVCAVEIVQRGDISQAAREGYARFVERMCAHATNFLEAKTEAQSALKNDGFWTEFETAVLDMNRYPEVKHVAGVAANDGKRLLDVERVSVAVKKGKKTTVVASSGVDEVQKRADQTRSLGKLAAEAIRLGQPVVFNGSTEPFGKKLAGLIDSHVILAQTRYLMLVPLFANDRRRIDVEPTDEEAARTLPKRKPIGCLIVEQLSDGNPPADIEKRANLLADHLSASLSNARTLQQIPMFSTLRSAGALRDWFHGRKLAKLLLAVAVLTAVTLALLFVPWEYRVKADGRLMPVQQDRVYTPVDGRVEAILVKSGQAVAEGDLLIRLDNPELEQEVVSLEGQVNEKNVLLETLRTRILDGQLDRAERNQLAAQIYETEAEKSGLEYQLKLKQFEQGQLEIRAPADGTVATFQVDQLLRGRPVNRGELLMELMHPEGEWRLEVEVPEHRLGHIYRGYEAKDTRELPVKYVLATATDKTFEGRLERIATRSNVSTEAATSVVEAYVDIDQADLPDRAIGAEVTAKFECGERSLGYVLFGDVVEFLQRHLWW